MRIKARPIPNDVIALTAIGFFFVAIYFFSYPRSLNSEPNFTSPRARVNYVLTGRWSEGFSYTLPFHDLTRDPLGRALTPRDAAFVDGKVVSKGFGGNILFFGTLQAVGKPLVHLAVPALAVASAGILSLITYELFGRRAAIFCYLLWLTFPPFWLNSAWVISPDVPALLALLLGVYLLLRYSRDNDDRWLVAGSISLALAIALRYPHLLVVVGILVVFLVARLVQLSAIPKVAIMMARIGGVLLLYNFFVNGGPLTTGQSLGDQLLSDTVNLSTVRVFSFDQDVFLSHLRTYFTNLPLFLPLYLGVAALGFLLTRENREMRVIAASAIAVTLLLLVYYGGRHTWGSQDFFLNASFLRYLLPAMALWMPFYAGLAEKLAKRWTVPALILVGLILGANVFVTLTSRGGIFDQREDASRIGEIRREVLDTTEADALIVTRLMDKALFPDRQTVTATYLVQNSSPVEQDRLLYRYLPSVDRLSVAIARFAGLGVPVYILNDAVIKPRDMPRFESLMSDSGFRLQVVGLSATNDLIRVVTLPGPSAALEGDGLPVQAYDDINNELTVSTDTGKSTSLAPRARWWVQGFSP